MTSQLADTAAVLFANDAFYLAFRTRDADAMDAIWSQRERVACIHPGWQVLRSRIEVIASWRGILEADQSPEISVHSAQALLMGECAVVVCYERVDDTDLAATNVFAREGGGWKLVHHQSGICQDLPESGSDEDELMIVQ